MKDIKDYFISILNENTFVLDEVSLNKYFDEFNKNFKNYLNALQNDGQEVEIQYKTNTVDNKICYSCLMIGRK